MARPADNGTRQKICALILCFMVFALVCANAAATEDQGSNLAGSWANGMPEGWLLAASNSANSLIVNPLNGQFAVKQAAGKVWHSIPEGVESDPLAKGKNRLNQQSLMIIKYGNPLAGTLDTVSSQAGSVQRESVTTVLIDNGIRVTYDFTGPKIRIPMEVTLGQNQLSVRIATDKIEEYGEDLLYEVHLLPAMASGAATDTGWILVPDGSGALIRFNNGRHMLSEYSAAVYGKDINTSIIRKTEMTQSIRLPVFGIATGEAAMLGHIVDNASLAFIEASVAGRNSSYNKVSSRFVLRRTEPYVMGQSTGNSRTVTLYSTAPLPEGQLGIDYHFLEGDMANLPGMAALCKRILFAGNPAGDSLLPQAAPVYITVLGGVLKEVPVLGIPTKSIVPVTTFQSCGMFLSDMNHRGLGRIVVRYQNWNSDALWGKVNDSAKPERVLGGTKELQNLLSHPGATIYLDADFTYVGNWEWGYRRNDYASKSISNIPTVLYEHDIATFFRDRRYEQKWLLSPFKLKVVAERFLESLEGLRHPFLSTGEAASLLYTDYAHRGFSREDSRRETSAVLERFLSNGLTLMVSGGNSYAATSAAHILDAPLASSSYDILNESVPFYQMVFHGKTMLGSESINLAEDPQRALLYAVQGGSMLHYTLIDPAGSEALNNTIYNHLYSAGFDVYADIIEAQYESLAPLYNKIAAQPITGFEILDDNVTLTRYEDGTEVLVNFSDVAYLYRGTEVHPVSYHYWLEN